MSLFICLLCACYYGLWGQKEGLNEWCKARLPDKTSFEIGALLEPLSVAIHAVRRASLPAQGASVLIFGAGAIGLLCAAVCKAKGARNIMIVDTQGDRIQFATSQRFANNELKVEAKRGTSVEENLQVAKDTAERLCVEKAQGGFDVVMECTGAEGPTQTAIYVGCYLRSREWSNQMADRI